MSYSLIDCIYRNKTSQGNFEIPSSEDISKLKVGDLAKLVFVHTDAKAQEPHAERMWVILTEVNGQKFKGTLDNDPTYIKTIKYQDVIEFEDRHICNMLLR